MEDIMEKKILRKADFLEIVPISESSLNRLIKQKKPPFDKVIKLNRMVLIPSSIVTDFEKSIGETVGRSTQT
jgi:hypothetical protein